MTNTIKAIIILIGCAWLVGCSVVRETLLVGSGAVPPGGPYLGQPSKNLIAKMGLPDKTMKLDNGEAWQYTRCSNSSYVSSNNIDTTQDCKRWIYSIRDGTIVEERSAN